ncbi:MAG: hypothetical protein QM705_15285 [Ancrocorticia sp.]
MTMATESTRERPFVYEVVPARQLEIPPTTRERYITGIYALNIEAPEDTSGDWHDVFHWCKGQDVPAPIMCGGTDQVNTNHIYGDLGVYEGRANVAKKGLEFPSEMTEIYVANHFRAILDMVHHCLITYGKIYNLHGATVDWLDTKEQQRYVLDLAAQMAPDLSEDQQVQLNNWIESELARF